MQVSMNHFVFSPKDNEKVVENRVGHGDDNVYEAHRTGWICRERSMWARKQ